MTKTQITAILSDLGYSLNKLVDLKEVSYIYTLEDGAVYPNEETRFKFNTSNGNELVEIFYGTTKDGIFTPKHNFADVYMSFAAIGGFVLVGPTHLKEPYRIGQGV